MADKEMESIIAPLESVLDICYIARFEAARCMPLAEALARGRRAAPRLDIRDGGGVVEAYHAALAECREGDVVLVTGSFMTVAAVRPLSLSCRGSES